MSKLSTILVVFPNKSELRVFEDMPPLGLAWIAAVLRENGFTVYFLDQQVDHSDSGLLVERLKPSLVLIGGTSHSRFEAFCIAENVKRIFPPATVVYGGPHASFTAQDTLSNIHSIDIVVHGEGEYSVLDIARWKEAGGETHKLTTIAGISYRKDGVVVSNCSRSFINNLDILPEPARDLLPMKKYRMELEYLKLPAASIITARGCPIGCSYCSASRMFQNHYAYRSAHLVVNEIEGLILDYAIKGFKIFDSTFTLNRNHVIQFCDELKKRGLNLPWECEVRVGSVDRDLLQQMKKAGCYYIDVGIESGDQFVLNRMRKQIFLEDAELLLRWAEELGIWVKAFFTIGHIDETYAAGKKTIAFIRKHERRIRLVGMNHGIRIYPGTQVEEHALKNRLLPDGFTWSKPWENIFNKELFLPVNDVPILLQPLMGKKELKRLRYEYGLMRLLTIRHIVFKIKHLMRYGQLKKYFVIIIRSMLKSFSILIKS